MTNTSTTNWKIISNAPETHKNDLLINLIEQNQILNMDTVNSWVSKEYLNLFNVLTLFQSIKHIDDSIVIYADFSESGVKEFTITSKIYTKDIFDKITSLIIDYQDKTDIELIYYYISENQMQNSEGLSKI